MKLVVIAAVASTFGLGAADEHVPACTRTHVGADVEVRDNRSWLGIR